MPKLEEAQQIPGRHARRSRSLRVSSTLAEINVVPLVDVMLVLLVIFMVTAPMMTEGFGVKLPQARNTRAIAAPLTISIPVTFRQDQRVRMGEELVRLDVLAVRVNQEIENRLDKSVIVASDGRITVDEYMRIVDKLKEAGVTTLNMQTQPPIAQQ
jgi:biopolymer transport protein ExbD